MLQCIIYGWLIIIFVKCLNVYFNVENIAVTSEKYEWEVDL